MFFHTLTTRTALWGLLGLWLAGFGMPGVCRHARAARLPEVIDGVQPKVVKIYGAGGFRGMETYQTGFLISGQGHILTAWSYVLDTDYVTVTLSDGRKFQGELVGVDPRLEIAVLKIDAAEVEHFNLDEAVEVDAGTRILAFTNLFGVATGAEPVSVLHGSVSARSTLQARRGVFQTPYHGNVYVLDAMTNNPGSAGGIVTDRQGRLIGMLGKELRNSLSNTWLNYALPIGELVDAADDIRRGVLRPRELDDSAQKPEEPLTLALLGLVLVPDILDRTPPFVDHVRRGSPADKAGLRPDDLVLFVGRSVVQSCKSLSGQLELVDRDDAVRLTIQRGDELIEVVLSTLDF